MAFKYEIKVFGDDKFYANNVAFMTKNEASLAGMAKYSSWSMADAYRVVESTDRANYIWDKQDGLIPLVD